MMAFTLRHRFWLEAFDSPLVMGGAMTLVDMEMAAAVCAVPCADLDRVVPLMLRDGPGWWAQLRFCWRALRRQADAEYGKLQAYLLDHGCPPATHGGGANPSGKPVVETLPGILGLVTGIIRGSGWEPETVWALSPGQAEWYLTGIFQHRGIDMRVKSSHDEEFEAGMRGEKAEMREGE